MSKVIVIVGPTGVGKTKLSIALASLLNGEIINADSTQVYKTLDIATAKIKPEEMADIPHHLFDIRNIDEEYTVFNYQNDCRSKIDEIIKKNKTPILVGGTGLYIKAALYDYNFSEENEHIDYDLDVDTLYSKLLAVDPNTLIHKNNKKRVMRALNYFETYGIPYSEKTTTDTLLYDAIFIGLTTNRDVLYKRIDDRVGIMVEQGLLDEAKMIYDSNIRSKAVMTPIGYKELFDYFEKKRSLEECLTLIKQKSRHYAKRQYTWNNHQFKVNWFNVNFDSFNMTVNEIYDFIKKY